MALTVHLPAQTPSVLDSGHWFTFSVAANGLYKIDYSSLKKAGFDPEHLDPRNLRLYGAGTGMLPQANDAVRINHLQELAIMVQGESDGKMDKQDYLLFYGQGPDAYTFNTPKSIFFYQNNLYGDKNFYFLTLNVQPGKRMVTAQNLGNNFPVINEFDDFGFYETDKYNILKSGRDWFGEQFDEKTEITVRFDFAGIVDNSSIKIVSAVMAQAYSSPSSFKVSFNSNLVMEQVLDPIANTQYAIKGSQLTDTITINSNTVSATSQSAQDIHYQYLKSSSGTSIGYLDYFLLSLKRKLALYGNQTIFTSQQSLNNAISLFDVGSTSQNSIIWDITDPFRSKVQSFALNVDHATFAVPTDTLRNFIVFSIDKIPLPVLESTVSNQNLSGMASPDLLIVTHPDFMSEALRLASHRQAHNQISVAVVTTQEIYNEYSGGKQDITAIRDFVKELYTRPGSGLHNLLLFGRCSYDYKNRVLSNTNMVPTYESRNSLSPLETYSSDDYFAFLESTEGEWTENPSQDNTMDVGVGRLSVTNIQEAKDVVDKLIDYDDNEKGFGVWRQKVVFVADDGDYSIHQSQADQLAVSIDQNHPDFITKKIYLDAFKQIMTPLGQTSPDTRDAIDRSLESGAMIVNFTGHGSEEQWMQERVLDGDLIKGWKNGPKYPLFVTATCEFGRHDDPFQISSGEKLLLQKNGGGIGLVTTARPVNSSTNFELNKAFYDALFLKMGTAYRDLGAIFRDTKNNSLSGVANRNFSLIGDPSMKLALPENEVFINQIKTAMNTDTLKALSSVVIKGEIQRSGLKRSDFNGEVEAILFDRPVSFTTLVDTVDKNIPFTFLQWSNIIFRGKASVVGGHFQLQFVVPKNLESNIGLGKLNLYADNGVENASGSITAKVGGAETIFPPDNTPPKVNLFIGDTTFVNGSVASPNTILITQLADAHGIAVSGYTGTDNLTATLDDSTIFILNEYYTAAKDDFTHGTADFPLKGLQKGKHHIVVQVSDTYSNRTSASIDFVVTDRGILVSDFYNYPNPFASFTRSTIFGFTHNRPGEDLDVELSVFDLMGQLVDLRQYSISSSFSHVTLAEWDGANAAGNKLMNGIYLGKLSVRSLLDGSKNEQITKLIIVN